MSAPTRSSPWSLRGWFIAFAIALPYVLIKDTFGITYPSWLTWIGIGVAGLVGVTILVSPDLASMKPVWARLFGTVALLAAVLGVYQQLTQIYPESV